MTATTPTAAFAPPGRCSAVDLAIEERCEGPVFLCG